MQLEIKIIESKRTNQHDRIKIVEYLRSFKNSIEVSSTSHKSEHAVYFIEMGNLNKWYLVCSVFIVTIATQSILYFDLSNKHLTVSSNYETLQEENDNLASQYADLSSRYSKLSVNHTLLNTKYSTLLLYYSDLENQYTDILQEFNALQTDYTNLETTFQELQTNYATLQESYADLETQFNQLQAEYDSLSENYETLEQNYDTLESIYTSLENEYNHYVSAYQDLRDKINQRLGLRFSLMLESFITPEDSSISQIVYSITGGWSDPSDWNEFWDDLKAMYMWIRNNVDYRYDGLSPELPYDPSGSVDYHKEMWQFANETLSLKNGDCEDQAILLCSMIRCYNNMEYWVECIGITSSTSGHLAVQIPVAEDKLVIFDPAGDYYSQDIWGNIAFNDITTEINNWLDYWKPQMGNDVYVSLVFSDYIEETFASTSEYINWMYSR